jgi:hypothetical protein
MRIQILVTGFVCVVLAQGQSFKTKWANSCFMNPASPVCKDHDFAIKPARGGRKGAANAFSATSGTGATARTLDNAIDWRSPTLRLMRSPASMSMDSPPRPSAAP